MKRYAFGSLSALLLLVITYFVSSEGPRQADQSVTTANRYAIQHGEFVSLINKATSGDCHAAERLGAHFMNYELSYEKAVKWYRVAASCQEVLPKEMLIILLNQLNGNRVAEAEVDRLILEVQAIDPARAKEIAANVKEARRRAGTSSTAPN